MAESKTIVSSSSSEQVRLLHLNLPTLTDENIKSQVQQTHSSGYSLLLRQPLLARISHIIKPATHFVDSILLDNKKSEDGIELETTSLLELNSTLLELDELIGDRCFSTRTLLEREVPNGEIVLGGSELEEFSTISELRTLARNDYFMTPALQMDKTTDNVVQRFDKINLHTVSMDILEYLEPLSWDAKAINTMACFVFKFLEFLAFLLHGPNQPITELASSMAALKESPISLMGSPLEKFQGPLDQLNSIIKLALEVIECISELTLLSDTEHSKENLLSTSAHWAILSLVTCYVQINLLMHNGEVALELSQLISNLSHILNDLRRHCTIYKPQIEEMEAHLQHIAFFEDAFSKKKKLSHTPAEMSELMKSFMYSKDGCHSFIDGSTMSQVDLEVLKGKAVIFFVSDLDIDTRKLTHLQSVYEQIKEEDYYKIVWVPFVLKWTEEMRQKFENLKSKMPWYIVCYDSPIAGVWYIKGRSSFFRGIPSFVIIDLQHGNQYSSTNPNCFSIHLRLKQAENFPFKRLDIGGAIFLSMPPSLQLLYPEPHEEDVNQKKPSSGFEGLVTLSRSRGSLNTKPVNVNPADATGKASHLNPLTSGNVRNGL